ncbi:MAG: DUF790 family protein [Ignisphaera sp.]
MTYGKQNLKLIYKRNICYPYYLDVDRDRDLIRDVIEFYEDNVGKRYGDIDWEELRIIVGDDKLYKALMKIMKRFYKPVNENIQNLDPKNLRARVFQLVNKLYGGFVPLNIRDEALEKIKNLLGIDFKGCLDSILWIDEVDEAVLRKVREVSIEDVVKVFNLETLDTIFVNSYKLFIDIYKYEKSIGIIAKIVGRTSKFHGIVYDMRYSNDLLKITIEGPRALFKRSLSSYGSRITLLITSILPLLSRSSRWSIYTYIYRSRAPLKTIVMSDNFKPLIGSINQENSLKEIFDSSIEESIYNVLRSLGIDIVREEEPIALGDLVYIPDFKISVNSESFYVEVVGYWRKEYIEKKIYKLNEISKVTKNIIVIADEKLKPYLEKLKIPVIYYTLVYGRPMLNYRKILEIIGWNAVK